MAYTWGYGADNGPHTWSQHFPDAAGVDQSPVNINTSDVIYDSDLTSADLSISYSQESEFTAENNGLGFKIDITQPSELSGGPLKDKYRLQQFHFHWGASDEEGSEHTVDGKVYPAELHLVHYNCTKYKDFGEAVSKPDGLAVLGILIEPGQEHDGFKVVSDTARSIKSNSSVKVTSSFNPNCLLPSNTKEFWTYHGSLTTPPCYESVQWIVFKEVVQYSLQQLKSLRCVLDKENHAVVNNYRPTLNLGSRKIRRSFN